MRPMEVADRSGSIIYRPDSDHEDSISKISGGGVSCGSREKHNKLVATDSAAAVCWRKLQELRFGEDLFGREKEIACLEEAFEKAKTVDRQLVLIHGKSGSGKSALAYHLRSTVLNGGGFFLGGKFDQNQQEEPYLAFTAACRELVGSLLADKHTGNKRPFTFEQVQAKLRRDLDASVLGVLTTVFPDLMQILGGNYLTNNVVSGGTACTNASSDSSDEQTQQQDYWMAAEMGYSEAVNRFSYAIRRLLRVIASFGRVVLFLDDIQWSDTASLDLMERIIADCKPNNNNNNNGSSSSSINNQENEEHGLIILASYRTEALADVPLAKRLQTMEHVVARNRATMSVDCSTIQVASLTCSQVNAMLGSLLGMANEEQTMPLAEYIHTNTDGNVLFVIELLRSLSSTQQYEHPPIEFDRVTQSWRWNVQDIGFRVEVNSKDIVDTIQTKLESLPLGIRTLLPAFAILGASFDKVLFDRVLWHLNRSVAAPFQSNEFLGICQQEGVLVHENDRVHFSHDKVQEACLALEDARTLASFRLKLARFLMMDGFRKDDQHSHSVFILVKLLDADRPAIPSDESNKLVLAEWNWRAGVKAMRGAAFHSAAAYLHRGIELLPKDHWSSHYKMSLDLFSLAAEAHFFIGNMNIAREYCNVVCFRADEEVPLLDKMRAYIILVKIPTSEGKVIEAKEQCLEVLTLLGCTFPEFGKTFYAVARNKFKKQMTVNSWEKKFKGLPRMTDKYKEWALHFLDLLMSYCFQCADPVTFLLASQKSIDYTLKYGACDYTPPIISIAGMLLDLESNVKFGEIALALYDNCEISPNTKARTLFVTGAFNLHWKAPARDLKKQFVESFHIGMKTGDAESALWSIACFYEVSFWDGDPIQKLETDCRMTIQQMLDCNQDKISIPTMAMHQVLLGMLGRSHNWVELYNPSGSDVECNVNTKGLVEKFHLTATFWNGNYHNTVKMIEQLDVSKGYFEKLFPSAYVLHYIYFMCAIAYFAVYHETKKSRHKKMALFYAKKVQSASRCGSPTYVRYGLIVEAESLSCSKKKSAEAQRLFKQAIDLANQDNVSSVLALAHERLGELYVRHGMKNDAKEHLDHARRVYIEWGAVPRSLLVGSILFLQRHLLQNTGS